MELANYQRELVAQIYQLLVDSTTPMHIILSGSKGCGKTTIANSIVSLLQEGWVVFHISGIDPDLSPYLTWSAGIDIHNTATSSASCKLAFGVQFAPLSVAVEFAKNSGNRNSILPPNEHTLLQCIKKTAGGAENILFIEDNSESWDAPSKKFLQKLMIPQLKLLDKYRVCTLSIQQSVPSDMRDGTLLSIPHISNEDMNFILRANGCTGHLDLDAIRSCSGDSIPLAIMAAQYNKANDIAGGDFQKLMDLRYNSLPAESQKSCEILRPLSIMNARFTKKEAAFFDEDLAKDSLEKNCLAEEKLDCAKDEGFIQGQYAFIFSSRDIQLYFKRSLRKREKYFHQRFASYLQENCPDDYYSRGIHLLASISRGDDMVAMEAWQLLFIAYIRRSTITGREEDDHYILDKIHSVFKEYFDSDFVTVNKHILDNLLDGYKQFLMYNYRKAVSLFQAIPQNRLLSACTSEVQRLILLCDVELADDRYQMLQSAEILYNTITALDFNEDELYCRAALVLLEVYTDRDSLEEEKAQLLNHNLNKIFKKHFAAPAFEELRAIYCRKAALYCCAAIAFHQTKESVSYYSKYNQVTNLYMSLCNHAGNAIVCGEYHIADDSLQKCKAILHDDPQRCPSHYKVLNNDFLLSYLIRERDAGNDNNALIKAAWDTIEALKKVEKEQGDETSYVIFFNRLGLSALCGLDSWHDELSAAYSKFTDADPYYQFFLHDLAFAKALLSNDLPKAQNEMDQLRRLNVPLLKGYRSILEKRRTQQEAFLNEPEMVVDSPFEYHKLIAKACFHTQDPSSYFWGRGFLLSDLQFLSF